MKTIVLTPSAAKDLMALPVGVQDAVEAALDLYATTGRGDRKALSGSGAFRLRVGRYRVIFDEDETTILAIYVGKRETSTYRKGRI